MRAHWLRILLTLLLLVWATAHGAEGSRAVFQTKGSFDEVKQTLELAIGNQGLVIAHWSEVAEMLARTGEDLGLGKPVYLHGGVVEFCSATLSRKMMEADPTNMVLCPYAIAIYVLPAAPDTVYLAYERLATHADDASRPALQEVDALLERICNEVVSW